jgi:hypothetical protein
MPIHTISNALGRLRAVHRHRYSVLVSTTEEWDKWLVELDSTEALAPDGYDDHAGRILAKTLGQRLISALASYEVQCGTTELYQDSTGMVGHRVTAKGDLRPLAPTLAWVLLSHFGDLATVKGCHDPKLLANVRRVLEDLGLKYIPYDYVAGRTYRGKCGSLVGSSWANRYFELCVEFNYNGVPGSPG